MADVSSVFNILLRTQLSFKLEAEFNTNVLVNNICDNNVMSFSEQC